MMKITPFDKGSADAIEFLLSADFEFVMNYLKMRIGMLTTRIHLFGGLGEYQEEFDWLHQKYEENKHLLAFI